MRRAALLNDQKGAKRGDFQRPPDVSGLSSAIGPRVRVLRVVNHNVDFSEFQIRVLEHIRDGGGIRGIHCKGLRFSF